MSKMNRRSLIKAMISAGAVSTFASPLAAFAKAKKPHVVVIGGGFGGASAAKYLKRFDQNIDVTLIEPKETYMTCPGSNWYLAGFVDVKTITQTYDSLKKHGIDVVHQTVKTIDPKAKKVLLDGGKMVGYDRLIVSTGIDFKYDAIEGYTPEVAESKIPHAYQAGPQTELLYQQIRDMKQGGTVVVAPPANPFRCPPGPYERVSMMAAYLKENNPTAKIMVMDSKNSFSKMGLFQEGWQELYGDMIEFIPAIDGGQVTKVDPNTMTVFSEYEDIQADVINIIPPQKASKLAVKTGLTDDSGWCPINQTTFESTLHPDVYVIGDACIAGTMPKSGHSAASQGRICAAAIVSELNKWKMPEAKNANTCYSLIAKDYGISIVGVYEVKDGKIQEIPGSGGVSPKDADAAFRKHEADYAVGWYNSITTDLWKS